MAGIKKAQRFDPSPILGSQSPVNMCIGARRIGKTYTMCRHGIRRYLKNNGEQWVYLRRYDEELKDTLAGSSTAFFHPFVKADEFPGIELRTHGRLMEIREEGEKRFHTMGRLMSLNKAQNYKGSNSDNTVGTIIFDEFIKEKHVPPYIPNEPDALIGLWSTLDGYNDTTRIYMLANAADIVNPYFMEWELPLPALGQTLTVPHGNSSIMIQYSDSPEFREAVKNTHIGKFVSGSSYERYSVDNRFSQDSGVFVAPKPSTAKYAYTIVFAGTIYAIWTDSRTGEIYVGWTPKRQQQNDLIFTLVKADMRPNMLQIDRASPMLRIIRNAWASGSLWFETDSKRETFMQSLKMIGVR